MENRLTNFWILFCFGKGLWGFLIEAQKWIYRRAQGLDKDEKGKEKEREEERKRGSEPYINDQVNNPFDQIPPVSPKGLPAAVLNGATLENSASNAFALIELNGLKWRCYKTPTNAPRGVHLSQDDVLKAYSKCIREGVVATWRRKPQGNPSQPEQLQLPSFTNDICKELWIFWYGNEHEKLKDFCEKLEQVQNDEFEQSTSPPITYEVRTLYFKALHGVLERTLMKHGHSRIGKWFCRPFRSHNTGRTLHGSLQYLRAFNFQFFVHGGNTVCITLTTENKPMLIRLGKRHLETRKRIKVVIAPWSWKGEVIPAHEAGDPAKIQSIQNTQYDEFKEFFPIEPEVESEDDWDSDEESEAEKAEDSDPPSPTQSVTPPPSPVPKPATPPPVVTPVPTPTPTPTKGRPKSKATLAAAAAVAAAAAAAAAAASAEEKKKEEEPEKPKKKKEHPFLEDNMPKMVVVEIAGVRFHYPTYLVYLTLEYDMECMNDSRNRDTHPVHVLDEHRVDESRRRNPVCIDELTSNSMIQSVFQSALLPKKIPAVPATPVTGDFAAPYVAQADDDTKWNFIDPGRNEKCLDEPQHVENSNYVIEDFDSFAEDRCTAYHRRFHKDSREKRPRATRDPLKMSQADLVNLEIEDLEVDNGDSDDEPPPPVPPELWEKAFIPSWIKCDKDGKAEITVDSAAPVSSYNIAINTPSTSEEEAVNQTELVCSPFTPIKCISPCNTCEWPSTVGPGDMPEEIFSQIFKPGGSAVPTTASQEERSSGYEHYYNPLMRDDPQFQPYHNKRVGEKRRASYPPPLPIPQSPDNPGSQETIPAVSSPVPEISPENLEKLKMKRSSTVPAKLDVSEEEIIPRKKGLKKKPAKIALESEEETDDFAQDWDNDTENDYFTHFDRSGIGCDDYEEVDNEYPSTTEREEEARQMGEPIFPGVEFSEEQTSMDVDHSVDNMLSPPASNEQYQPLSLKATGPPSVPDANQIFPTPPSVLETHQFSPAGMSTSVLSNLLHAPTVPSQLTDMDEMREGPSKEPEEPMETEESPTITDEEFARKRESLVSIEDKHPEHTRINNIIQRITDHAAVLQTPASVTKQVATIPDRFVLNEKIEPDDEPLPVDYIKLANQINARPQKPYIQVPKSAPHTVGSSSNRINMIALNHENRTQQEHQKAYNVTFTAIQAPMSQPHPLAMGYPYGRPGMPMRPGMHMGYGPPGQMGYGHMGMHGPPFNPHVMNSPRGGPGYPHMANPMYNPMNPMGGMGNMPGMPISPMHGPMAHMGPGMGMSSAMGMHPGMSHHAMQQYQQAMAQQQQQRQMMMMSQMGSHMGGGPGHHPGMNPGWQQHPMTPGGGPMPHDPSHHPMQSPISGMPPHLMQPGSSGAGIPPGPMGSTMYPQGPTPNSMTPAGINTQPQLPVIPQIRETTRISTYMQTLGKMSLQPLKMRNLPLGNARPTQKSTVTNIEIKYPSVPEASSLVLTLILQDTILDLHYDTSFDACPICSCNATIRTRELGLYLSPPEIVRKPTSFQQNIPIYSGFHWSPQQIQCNCGFSAVRHRYLSMYNGLFPEDAQEATGVTRDEAVTPALGPWANYDTKSLAITKYLMDSTVNPDRAVMNLMRIMCQKGYVGKEIFMLAYSQESLVRSLAPEDDCRGVPGSNSPYVVSYVDQTELLLLGNSAIDAALSPMRGPDRREVSHATFFHPWGIQVANELKHNDEEELLWLPCITKDLLPIFEEGMKSIKSNPEQTTVNGPLAWKELTKMRQISGKPAEEDCQPEPIPQIVVSNDRDMLRGSATMLPNWEKLKLGPVDQPKDVLYLAVIPDNAEVHVSTLKYMEEMSVQYEKLRLGKHVALCYDEVREGIIRAGGRGRPGTKYQNKLFNFIDLVDKEVQDKTFIARLRLFTQQMEEAVASVLERNDCLFTREEFRRQVAQESRAKKQHQLASAASGEKTHEEEINPSSSKEDQPGATSERRTSCLEELLNADTSMPPANPPALTATADPPLEPDEIPTEDYVVLPHVVVVYVINPFTFDPDSRTAVNARIAFAAILRTYNAICARIKSLQRTQLMLEVISAEEVQAYNQLGPCFMHDGKGFTNPKQSTNWAGIAYKRGQEAACVPDQAYYSYGDEMYQRCFDIYRAPRVLTPECARVCQSRFMTKCGPGYSLFDAINQWGLKNPPMLYTVPSCPYFLAPSPKLLHDASLDKIIQRPADEIVLYVSYCIVGGDYLIGTITDELGKLSESVIINMKPNLKGHIVNMNSIQFKSKTQIQDAMLRFMNFIHGIVTQGLNCVRLVIGRLGKMGHGEFKAWTFLLSKGNLRKLSQKPKEGCKACHDTDGSSGMPKILSACAISFEAEPYLRIFSGALKIELEQRRKTIPSDLMTPGDIGVTHIMTFTVSPAIDMTGGEQMGNDHDDENMDDTGFMDFGEDDLGLGEFGSIMEDVGASGMEEHPGNIRNFRTGTVDMTPYDQPADPLPNQPLATGFLISTSPAPDLPDWFWSSCPLKKKSNPLHFKASLHINTQSVGEGDDEDLTSVTGLTKKTTTKIVDGIEICHPLDNNKNDAVLRHVLETYNALSWLNMDRLSQDRVSCLPIHIQHLLRLYHSLTRIYL